MAARTNGQAIIIPLIFFFFPRLLSAVRDGISTILLHMMYRSCSENLQCILKCAARGLDANYSKITVCAPLHNFVRAKCYLRLPCYYYYTFSVAAGLLC